MSSEATEEVTLDELITLGIDAARQSLHTADVAVVVSYDRFAGTVEVSFPIGRMLPDGSGNFVLEQVPNMQDVPVCFPRCQAFALTFPLVAGDSGLVVFAMKNISSWRSTNQAGSPGDVATHTPDGAVFIPGVFADAHSPAAADAANMVIGSETDGKGRIEILPAGGHLGAGATKGVARLGDPVGITGGSYTPASITLNIKDGAGSPGTIALTVVAGVLAVTPVGVLPTSTFGMNGEITAASATWKAVD